MNPTPSPIPAETLAYARQFFDFARKGDCDSIAPALEYGLTPNLQNDKGDTLLMLACYNGHANLVTLLLKHGASPNLLNDRKQSCLAGVLFKKEEAIIQILIDARADPTYGQPSGEECMKMFGGTEKWGEIFATASGRGTGMEEEIARNAIAQP